MDSEIKKVQEHLLDIFSDVVKICEKLDIGYFIVGGTALGAVRHGGFIPWDDDLDIGMTRENYERFLAEAPRHLREDLFLQTFETEPNSPFYFAKVRKSNTVFMEKYCRNIRMHQGVSIDIFPYDHIPDGEREQKKHYRHIKYLMNLYAAKSVRETSVPYHGIKKAAYGTIRTVLHMLVKPVPKRYLYHYLEKSMKAYNSSETGNLGYGGLPKIQVSAGMVKEERIGRIGFEHLTVACPGEIETYLESNFGDYMKLPEEHERVGHRPYKIKV